MNSKELKNLVAKTTIFKKIPGRALILLDTRKIDELIPVPASFKMILEDLLRKEGLKDFKWEEILALIALVEELGFEEVLNDYFESLG